MNIKIAEKNGTWSLWATESGKDTDPPLYTASRRTRDQIINLLRSIVDETATPEPAKAKPVEEERKNGAQQALYAMMASLDSWIDISQSNHEAMGHRHENPGEECWRQYAPGDIRNMINDAARELDISTFPIPLTAKEDAR